MFYGSFEHSVDAKGRLSIPSRFRDVMAAANENTFFITMDFVDQCTVAYPFSQWREIDAKARSLSVTNTSIKLFLRSSNLHGSECQIDKQGRILIPASLREVTGLQRDVRLVGMSNKIEIWDSREVYEAVPSSKEEREEINKDLFTLGL